MVPSARLWIEQSLVCSLAVLCFGTKIVTLTEPLSNLVKLSGNPDVMSGRGVLVVDKHPILGE